MIYNSCVVCVSVVLVSHWRFLMSFLCCTLVALVSSDVFSLIYLYDVSCLCIQGRCTCVTCRVSNCLYTGTMYLCDVSCLYIQGRCTCVTCRVSVYRDDVLV